MIKTLLSGLSIVFLVSMLQDGWVAVPPQSQVVVQNKWQKPYVIRQEGLYWKLPSLRQDVYIVPNSNRTQYTQLKNDVAVNTQDGVPVFMVLDVQYTVQNPLLFVQALDGTPTLSAEKALTQAITLLIKQQTLSVLQKNPFELSSVQTKLAPIYAQQGLTLQRIHLRNVVLAHKAQTQRLEAQKKQLQAFNLELAQAGELAVQNMKAKQTEQRLQRLQTAYLAVMQKQGETEASAIAIYAEKLGDDARLLSSK